MRCKVCGAMNEDFMEYCENCAAPLTQAGSVAAPKNIVTGTRTSWSFTQDPVWPSPEFSADNVSEADVPDDFTSRYQYDASDFTVSEQDVQAAQAGQQQYAQQQYAAPQQQPQNGFAPEYDDFQDDGNTIRYAEPVQDYNFYSYDDKMKSKPNVSAATRASGGSRRSSKRANTKALLFYGAAGLLVVTIAVLLIVFLTGKKGGDAGTGDQQAAITQTETDIASTQTDNTTNTTAVTGNKQSAFKMFFASLFGKSPLTRPATIELDTSGTEKAYLITVYAKKGCTYRFTAGSLVSENPIDGSVSLRVPEQVWIPGEPVDGNVLTITPDVVVIDSSGVETQVQFDEAITIELPTLSLNVTTPTDISVSVSDANLAIAGTVDDNTALVFANDMQLTVDVDGNFSGTYALPAAGTQDVVIEARKNGYAIARKTITVELASNAAGTGTSTGFGSEMSGSPAFTIASDQTRRTTEATLTIKGTVQDGATLTVSGADLNGTITTDASGNYQFAIALPEVGLYTVVITSDSNGVNGTRTLYVERSHADSNVYMEGTHALDYQYLQDSPYHKQGYTITGTIAEIIQAEPYMLVRMTTDKGDIVFAYYSGITAVEAGDGKTYKVFADPNGRYEDTGIPLVYAWYIKKS